MVDPFIAQHFVTLPVIGFYTQLYGCKQCGDVAWDPETHLRYAHGINRSNPKEGEQCRSK